MLLRSLRALLFPALLLALLLLAACTGPTSMTFPPVQGDPDIKVTVDPPTLQTGQKATFNYQFISRATGKVVLDLPKIWTKPVHVVMVDHDMNWFQHSYAEAPTAEKYPVQVIFDQPGFYNMWLEYTDAAGAVQRYHHSLAFGEGGFESVAETPAQLTASTTMQKVVYGVDVRLQTSELHAGQPAKFTYTFSEKDKPLATLSPYLGAAGHLYSISADFEAFNHTVSMTGAPGGAEGGEQPNPSSGGGTGSTGGGPQPTSVATAEGAGFNVGPEVEFEHEFEKPGLYKTWGQFMYQGVVINADFVVNVQP